MYYSYVDPYGFPVLENEIQVCDSIDTRLIILTDMNRFYSLQRSHHKNSSMHFEISPFDLMKTTLRPRQRKGAKPAVAAVAFSSVDANDEHKKVRGSMQL